MFPYIHLSGPPYERGKQYGSAVAPRIRNNVETYFRIFAYYAGLSPEQALTLAEELLPIIEDYDDELYTEMMGIAAGAGVRPSEIMMLNARSLLMASAPLPGECTAVAAVPPASQGNDVLLAQTWDWLNVCRGNSVLLRIRRQDASTVLAFAEAGQLGKFGFNDAGLGLCLNWLESPMCRRSVPAHVLTRRLLQCETIEEVKEVVHQTPRAGAGNFLVVQADGRAISIETTPEDVCFMQPEQGLLVHTNHYCSLYVDGVTPDQDSFARLQRARCILGVYQSSINIGLLRTLHRDHGTGDHDAICVHSTSTEEALERWTTLGAFSMNLRSLTLDVSAGSPCSNTFAQYRLFRT